MCLEQLRAAGVPIHIFIHDDHAGVWKDAKSVYAQPVGRYGVVEIKEILDFGHKMTSLAKRVRKFAVELRDPYLVNFYIKIQIHFVHCIDQTNDPDVFEKLWLNGFQHWIGMGIMLVAIVSNAHSVQSLELIGPKLPDFLLRIQSLHSRNLPRKLLVARANLFPRAVPIPTKR